MKLNNIVFKTFNKGGSIKKYLYNNLYILNNTYMDYSIYNLQVNKYLQLFCRVFVLLNKFNTY